MKKSINDTSIYQGDCLRLFKKISNNSVDLIATDPPYFLDGMDNKWSEKNLKHKKSKAGTIKGLPVGMKFDPKQGKRLQTFFEEVSNEMIRVLKPGGFLVSFSQGRLYHRMTVAAEDVGFEIRDMLIWEHNGGQGKAFTQDHFIKKMNITEQEKKRAIHKLAGRKTPQLRPKFEPMMLAQKPKDGTFVNNWLKWKTGLIRTNFEDKQQTTIFEYNKPKRMKTIDHMTVKPVELMIQLMEVFSLKNQVVLDPFMGSGTTGVAALMSDRKFIGFELEQKYFDMSFNRLKNYKNG